LPAGLVREFGKLAGKLRRHDLLRRDAPRVEFFDAAELVGFESLRVAVNGTDKCCPLLFSSSARVRLLVCDKQRQPHALVGVAVAAGS
jgi:hypothetical protein